MTDGGLVTLGETLGLLVADDVGPLSLARGMRLSMGGAESNVAIASRASGSRRPGSGASATTRSAT